MRWALFVIMLAVTPALGAPHSGGLPDSIHGPANGAFEVPLYGAEQEIWGVWRTPDNHLVLEFVYKKRGLLQSDFYDTATGLRAYPDQENKAATDNSVSKKYTEDHRLARISVDLYSDITSDYVVYGWDHSGKLCSRSPYMGAFKTGAKSKKEFFLFQKLAKPLDRKLRGYCGSGNVSYRYTDRSAQFYSNKNGFFAQIDRFLIWFDWNLSSEFLKSRDDYVVIPSAALEDIAHKSKRPDGGAYEKSIIREMDRVIDEYGARQLKEKKHV